MLINHTSLYRDGSTRKFTRLENYSREVNKEHAMGPVRVEPTNLLRSLAIIGMCRKHLATEAPNLPFGRLFYLKKYSVVLTAFAMGDCLSGVYKLQGIVVCERY